MRSQCRLIFEADEHDPCRPASAGQITCPAIFTTVPTALKRIRCPPDFRSWERINFPRVRTPDGRAAVSARSRQPVHCKERQGRLAFRPSEKIRRIAAHRHFPLSIRRSPPVRGAGSADFRPARPERSCLYWRRGTTALFRTEIHRRVSVATCAIPSRLAATSSSISRSSRLMPRT